MGSELLVLERLTFNKKIERMRIAWLDDSAKISPANYRCFTVYTVFPQIQPRSQIEPGFNLKLGQFTHPN